ncbi:ATP-dependent DNA helicase [Capnocytophaga granulosa]|uniref:ATP-dependent DNA helicase n=1 Tax=Capnocytophaga granulosa TaxID=45242 RepID=UPI0023EFDF87|nr:AAA family ATPase [Capnocytophaga granulosa]
MSTIFNHFQDLPLTDDQCNALEKIEKFLSSDTSIFILKGYAGSGKTTLLKGLVSYLQEESKQCQVMAPTGRAAKILRKKVGQGATIHKTIYAFDDVETDVQTYKYRYPVRINEAEGQVFIVDEASMVSNVENKQEFFQFGTDILLADLLTYTRVERGHNKIIFVGDPAQLPPVKDSVSQALNTDFFEKLGLKYMQTEMTQVARQGNNLILKNATTIRKVIEQPIKSELVLDYDDDFVKINIENVATQYAELFPMPELGQGVVIAYTNEQCLHYNQSIRSKIFPNTPDVIAGDILLINQNNYIKGVEFFNGDMVKVLEVSDELVIRRNIPVFEKGVKNPTTLTFREVKLLLEGSDTVVECYIIDSLLNSIDRDLSIIEKKALFVDFVIRFREKYGDKYKEGSREFKEALKEDPYFNALRVKYGYAITCHKSQGGEWDTTFVDYSRRRRLDNDALRWSYTATTRAVNRCYAANAPYTTCFSSFQISEIGAVSKMPNETFSLRNIPLSPFHKEGQHRAKSLKYWEVVANLENTPYRVEQVESKEDYHERYTISNGEQVDVFDAFHSGAGIFEDFIPLHRGATSWQSEVLMLLNKPNDEMLFEIDYTPSTPLFEKLYGLMQSACEDTGVTITNIEEKPANYMVLYCLKTDKGKGAYIQFYFNSKQQLTRTKPKSMKGADDQKLQLLIQKLKEYVI